MTRQCLRCDAQTERWMCEPCAADEMFERECDEPDMDEDEMFLEYECGWMPGGGCMLAGTEQCDWECPRGRHPL